MTKEGIDRLIKLFYNLAVALFSWLEHINERNFQNIAV